MANIKQKIVELTIEPLAEQAPQQIAKSEFDEKYNEGICVKSNPVLGKVATILDAVRVETEEKDKFGNPIMAYLAQDNLRSEIIRLIEKGIAFKVTGKIDGTCTYVINNCLCKRRDIKNAKQVIPKTWIATGAEDGTTGHKIGFMPLEKGDKWHLDCHVKLPDNSYDMSKVVMLILNADKTGLEYNDVDIASLEGMTVEVIGPKWQNNIHKVSRHCIISHGLIELKSFPDCRKYANGSDENGQTALQAFRYWFKNDQIAPFIEGVVIHFATGELFKIHRDHLALTWNAKVSLPLEEIKL